MIFPTKMLPYLVFIISRKYSMLVINFRSDFVKPRLFAFLPDESGAPVKAATPVVLMFPTILPVQPGTLPIAIYLGTREVGYPWAMLESLAVR